MVPQHPTSGPLISQQDGKKEADDKEVPVDPSSLDKKLWISTCLDAK
jgi:hypothetical protein